MPVPLPPHGGRESPLPYSFAYPVALVKGGDRIPNSGFVRNAAEWDLFGGSACTFADRFGLRGIELTNGSATGYFSKTRSGNQSVVHRIGMGGTLISCLVYIRSVTTNRSYAGYLTGVSTRYFFNATTGDGGVTWRRLRWGNPNGTNVNLDWPTDLAGGLFHLMVCQDAATQTAAANYEHFVAKNLLTEEIGKVSTSVSPSPWRTPTRIGIGGGLVQYNTGNTTTLNPDAEVFSFVLDFQGRSPEWMLHNIHDPWWYLRDDDPVVKGVAAATSRPWNYYAQV